MDNLSQHKSFSRYVATRLSKKEIKEIFDDATKLIAKLVKQAKKTNAK